jgi:hypothetical protein
MTPGVNKRLASHYQTISDHSAVPASFADPPGVRGTGVPSGGQYPANGVMTYYPRAANGSWMETCTLPAGQKAECTASLNAFLARYGKL